jgi:hypothetical protein
VKLRVLAAFAVVVFLGGLLSGVVFVLSIPRPAYWGFVLLVAVGAAIKAAAADRSRARLFGRSTEFLCDTCRYNSDRDCSRPERPNATRCPDYKLR